MHPSTTSKLRSASLALVVTGLIWVFAERESISTAPADTIRVASVPVWFSMPPTEDAGKWIVELQDKSIADVTLTGPTDQLERIRSGRWPVRAMITLSADDLTRAVQARPATFPDLPPGVGTVGGVYMVRLARIQKQ